MHGAVISGLEAGLVVLLAAVLLRETITRPAIFALVAALAGLAVRLYVHQFHIRAPGELDDEFAGWILEAYQVGNGAHLGPRPHTTLAP